MKKIFTAMIILMFLIPTVIGLLQYKSPIVLPEEKILKKITYFETESGEYKECGFEEYLVGVLAAEMPAEYHIEALKAQAVAARSFIISRIGETNPDHPKAVVCDAANHCKAYIGEVGAKEKWKKTKADEYWQKLEQAVENTSGEYMVCGNEVVEAFFFARSNGKTENSEDVWGEERAYLKSVDSEGDKTHPEFESVAEFETEDARRRLNRLNSQISMGTAPLDIGEITRTAGGNIATIRIDGISFSGKDIRQAFGLKSADFFASNDGNMVKFRVFGYGHGVGMSQFGANYMAENGENYTEILTHYYSNIQIVK